MNVLIIGSGGREHALAWKISRSRRDARLFTAPGNAGTARLGRNVPIHFDDLPALLSFARDQQIDLTVVGPEAPLVSGVVDLFRDHGLAIVGPDRRAAALEGSKAFAKEFMRRHHIPTARYAAFTQAEGAERELRSGRFSFPVVVKADGLAAGKGVFICPSRQEASQAVQALMRERIFGAAGDRVIIEEFLEGEEASFMVFADGGNILPMVPSQDHKAIHDGDQGPNTGGMGAYSDDSILGPGMRRRILEQIMGPAIEGMAEEDTPFRGILYAGLMLTAEGPKVLEFNVRLGDPETQVVLPRLKSDLVDILEVTAAGTLQGAAVEWDSRTAVCVVLAAAGYPGSYEKGKEVHGLEMAEEMRDTAVFHAGTVLHNGKVLSSGGRVLGVTSWAATLEGAAMQAYEAVSRIHFDGMYCRRDIAAKGLARRASEGPLR